MEGVFRFFPPSLLLQVQGHEHGHGHVVSLSSSLSLSLPHFCFHLIISLLFHCRFLFLESVFVFMFVTVSCVLCVVFDREKK